MVFWLCREIAFFALVFFLMIRRPPRSTLDRSSAASDVYKRQHHHLPLGHHRVAQAGVQHHVRLRVLAVQDAQVEVLLVLLQRVKLDLLRDAVDEEGFFTCLLYPSDAADERSSVDLGGRRIFKKNTTSHTRVTTCSTPHSRR